jgi:hypothetical protein
VPATLAAGRDPDSAAAAVGADRQPVTVDPSAAADAAAAAALAVGVEHRAPITRVLSLIAAATQVIGVPARPGGGGERAGRHDEPGRLLIERQQQRPSEDAGGGTGPVQPHPAQERHGRQGDDRGAHAHDRESGEQMHDRVKRRAGHGQPPP